MEPGRKMKFGLTSEDEQQTMNKRETYGERASALAELFTYYGRCSGSKNIKAKACHLLHYKAFVKRNAIIKENEDTAVRVTNLEGGTAFPELCGDHTNSQATGYNN
jgi:hypothetical protein